MSVATLNKYALIGSTVVLLLSFWNRNDIPGNIAFHPGLEDEPRQEETRKPSFSARYDGIDYLVEPEYEYELYGMIVSYRHHDGKSTMHRRAKDHLNVADVCVVWSDTAMSEYLNKLHFWNGIFTCNVKTSDGVAWAHFKMNQLSNNHLISDDPAIREEVARAGIGDQIRIKGWLSSYGAAGGGKRGTSTTRDDTGDGACETIFVDEFEIVQPAFNRWRAAMYLSLMLLGASLVVHFTLPYRPQG